MDYNGSGLYDSIFKNIYQGTEEKVEESDYRPISDLFDYYYEYEERTQMNILSVLWMGTRKSN